MNWSLWLELHLHFCMLSLLAVGGALAIVPEMHRYLVNDLHCFQRRCLANRLPWHKSHLAPISCWWR